MLETGVVATGFINSRTAWFTVLDHAHDTGKFELAAKASKELERLGVKVRFTKKRGARP